MIGEVCFAGSGTGWSKFPLFDSARVARNIKFGWNRRFAVQDFRISAIYPPLEVTHISVIDVLALAFDDV